jgi:ubiquinone/menaquinone biosynthesis C-methylase UbiE
MHDDLRTRLRESYDRTAQQRDGRTLQAWKVEERQAFLKLLQHEQKHTLLEIGAGAGTDAQGFQERGLTVTCIDLSPAMVDLCRQKGLAAQVMDFAELQFRANSFDAVYALNCLLHAPKVELPDVLREIDRVLNDNGLFYMGVYGGYDFEGIWEDDTYEPKRFFSFFTDEHLRQALEETFQVYSFKHVPLGAEDRELHFQSIVLGKKDTLDTTI